MAPLAYLHKWKNQYFLHIYFNPFHSDADGTVGNKNINLAIRMWKGLMMINL